MKVITTEKVIKETITKYEAFDGNIFDSVDECKNYENTAYAVVKKEYLQYQINKLSEFEFYDNNAGCDEYDIAIVDIKDEKALEAVNRYIVMSRGGENAHLISSDYIGKKIAMSLGFPYYDTYDSVGYVYGTIEEIIEYRLKTLNKIFNPTDDKKVVNEACS